MSVLAIPAVDLWAMLTAAAACLALALRAEVLKPELLGFHSSPSPVRLSLTFLAATLGGRVISIAAGAHAIAPEALVYSALAVSSWVLLINLHRQRPRGLADHPGGRDVRRI